MRTLGHGILVVLLLIWVLLTVQILYATWQTEAPLIHIEVGSPVALVWLLATPPAWVMAWSLRGRQTRQPFFEVLSERTSDALMVYNRHNSLLWNNAAARSLFPDEATLPSKIKAVVAHSQKQRVVVMRTVQIDGSRNYHVQALPVENNCTALIVRVPSEEMGHSRFYENFIRRIVHDMRNPLAAIIGHAANLKAISAPIATQITESSATIEDQAQRLARLVDSMLFDARLAYVPLSPESLDLVELVEEALYTVEERALTDGKQIVLEMPPTVAQVTGDRDLLVRAFENLLDNSLKYTDDDGKIQVRLKTARDGFHLSFADNGEGIAPEYLPDRIFEPLVRAKHGPGGSGLGLSIVKKIIEMHGGTIRVESQQKRGTIMHIHLPVSSGEA